MTRQGEPSTGQLFRTADGRVLVIYEVVTRPAAGPSTPYYSIRDHTGDLYTVHPITAPLEPDPRIRWTETTTWADSRSRPTLA